MENKVRMSSGCKVYLANMEEKMQEEIFLNDTQALLRPSLTFNPQEEIFLNDTQALLRPSLTFNPQEAYEIVKSKLIEKI